MRIAVRAGLLLMVLTSGVLGYTPATSAQPTGTTTLPVSDSVVATIVRQGDSLSLMVLWRGAHRWFLRGGRNSSGGGGSGNVVTAWFQYGDLSLDVTVDRSRRQLSILGKSRPISDDLNVVLVEDADLKTGPRIVKMLSVPADARDVDLRRGSLAPFFKRSPELVAFLQCGNATDGRSFDMIGCGDPRE
jgi:hypothetical protein